MFKSFKKDYMMSNLYTMEEVTDCFADVNTNIIIYCLGDDGKIQFSDWVALFDSIYHKKIDSPWCSEGHIFTVCSENLGKLVIMVDDLKTKSHTQNMIQKKRKHIVVDWQQLLLDAFDKLKTLDLVGLSNIEKIEMGTKDRPLVPKEYRDCPLYAVPSKLTMAKEKIQKSQKKVSKLELKAEQEALDPKIKDIQIVYYSILGSSW